jgi:hypothetical protein
MSGNRDLQAKPRNLDDEALVTPLRDPCSAQLTAPKPVRPFRTRRSRLARSDALHDARRRKLPPPGYL